MSRTPFIVGNWKMHKTLAETRDFCERLKQEWAAIGKNKVAAAVAPPFTSLAAAADVLKGSPIGVAAQDVFWETKGAYTGEVSPGMLADAGCRLAIVGHSERRQFFYETDESVNRKVSALKEAGLVPILCIGETLSERQGGGTLAVVERQMRQGLKGFTVAKTGDLVIAYEPVWAIGTGQTATPRQAQEIHSFLRGLLEDLFTPETADRIPILYGGSVKAENIRDLMAEKDADGALVGGASLEVQSFLSILRGCL
jgi:triosephosphate isomerase